MTRLTFKDYLSEYEKFSEEQKNLILEYAPQIRMLRANKTARSIVQAYPYHDNLNLAEDATIILAPEEDPLEAYLAFVKKTNQEPAFIVLNQEILFSSG